MSLLYFPSHGSPAAGPGVADWPTIRHDAQNTALSSDQISPPLRLDWRARTLYAGRTLKNVFLLGSAGVVCVGCAANMTGLLPVKATLYDGAGAAIWAIPNAVPVYLHGQRLVLVEADSPVSSAIRCYAWPTHQLIWSTPARAPLRSFGTAVQVRGLLYCFFTDGTGDKRGAQNVLTLRITDGTIIKAAQKAGVGFANVAADDNSLFIAGATYLYVVDRRTLRDKAQYLYGGSSAPVAALHEVVTLGPRHEAQAWDTSRGRQLWDMPAWRDVAPCLIQRRSREALVVIAPSRSTQVAAVDIASGKTVWRNWLSFGDIGGQNQLAFLLAATAHFVFAPGSYHHQATAMRSRGGFYCFRASDGKLVWSYERAGDSGECVIVSGNCLYALDSAGYLYKFGSATRIAALKGRR